jgi:hypothetical protein
MDFNLVAKIFDRLNISPPSKLILLEAQTLASAHVPPYPPDVPVLVTNVDSQALSLHLKQILLTTYPEHHKVYLVFEGEKKEQSLEDMNQRDAERFSLYICLRGRNIIRVFRGDRGSPARTQWMSLGSRTNS